MARIKKTGPKMMNKIMVYILVKRSDHSSMVSLALVKVLIRAKVCLIQAKGTLQVLKTVK